MSFTVVIPARYASTRLPGKPLLDLDGWPMIRHVHARACESGASRVIVATDDERIADICGDFGAEVAMTDSDHASGTDRLEEVARRCGLAAEERVVNVQGDEPLIPPALINQVAQSLQRFPDAAIATLCERLHDVESVLNPNIVKVVRDREGYALYFSRAPIPWARDQWADGTPASLPPATPYFRHIGIYGYRARVLHDFVNWPPSLLEQVESLEQLRAMENGARIHVDEALEVPPGGVDTEADLERVRAVFQNRKQEK
ncbi:3-deoxy-manno-octulosonate cytidylyltransferase (CMP-KDO synthetase) [Tamilnaduibacter salinus]|uniref:3-deoxy-manno-octulosonate cytidylyltransferase n=1 Tax=Tamilnaduibacter salinus TaxID=1484056 RepID=A0A2U1CUZ8_9GAMM|nr:3-deoxy-manno-octulosonate cytidylyltransferase [Tamilnaduibacter salinus]PVY75320.1 3-deoxy-manno-octulosonate cytidylyltransferase (CMP-KDO synthetase) [Tamilnaduibacter salinus]